MSPGQQDYELGFKLLSHPGTPSIMIEPLLFHAIYHRVIGKIKGVGTVRSVLEVKRVSEW